jgi:exodeoxyribonuclease VII large subunit
MVRLSGDDHRDEESDDIYTVSEISDALRQHLESEFHDVSVLGEIANFKAHSSGHLYFSLRDESNLLRAVLFRRNTLRIGFEPENGQLVIATGGVSHYGGSGQTQLIAHTLLPAGRGLMEIEYRRLLQSLMQEGLTATELKRPIPAYPDRIVIITSPTGAVIRDMVDAIERRWPVAELLHICVDVQGASAERSIVRAFERANGLENVDIVILARGGGSVEDLWTFNLESVARAVAGSRHPVITGIGHEIDTTVCDHVSDLRASTPAAAAEIATPDMVEVKARIDGLDLRISSLYRRGAEGKLRMLEYMLRSSSFPAIEHRLDMEELGYEDLATRLGSWFEGRMALEARRVDALLLRLGASISDTVRRYEGLLVEEMELIVPLDPRTRILVNRGYLERISRVMEMLVGSSMETRRGALTERLRMLGGLHPLTVLRRGYTYCTEPEGDRVIARTGDVARGDEMMVHFYDGGALCTVERTRKGRSWRRRRDSRKR